MNFAKRALLAAAAVWLSCTALAATIDYTYDSLGRLQQVKTSDGRQTVYTLDPAGNRVSVEDAVAPGTPPSITVPLSSSTGSYSVSWGVSTGTVSVYELYESPNASFSSSTRVFVGVGTSASFSGKGNGTFYYQVRACKDSACSDYRNGANPIVVSIPIPPPPTNATASQIADCAWRASWSASSGATFYNVGDTTGVEQQTTALSINITCPVGNPNAKKPKWVQACSAGGCSSKVDFFATPPGAPSSISVPSSSSTGSYTITWGAASGTVTAYELYESTSSAFTSSTLVYSGTATSYGFSGKGEGTYYYRVRACNGSACSGVTTGANGIVVAFVPAMPGAPSSISVPSSSLNGSYTISWGTASGAVTAYELYESRDSFSSQTLVYSGASTAVGLSGRVTGTYYYRVRACNGALCSGYTTGSNSLLVKLPPSTPASITVPSVSTAGLFEITWGAADGIVEWYELYQATNSAFSGESLVFTGGQLFYDSPQAWPDGSVFYYRVRACNTTGCSSLLAGSNPVVVAYPPPPPPAPTGLVSRQVADCAWTASWNASPGATRYHFGTTNGTETDTTNLSITISCPRGQPNSNKPKWVQACSANGCSSKANF